MRKSVIATLMHNTNFDDAETRHRYCPKNIDSWCKNQKDILTEEKTYKDYVTMPVPIKNRSTANFLRFKLRGITIKMFGRSNTKEQRIIECSYLEEMLKRYYKEKEKKGGESCVSGGY